MSIIYTAVYTRSDANISWVPEQEPNNFSEQMQEVSASYITSGHITSFTHSNPNDLERHIEVIFLNEEAENTVTSDPQWNSLVNDLLGYYSSVNIDVNFNRTIS